VQAEICTAVTILIYAVFIGCELEMLSGLNEQTEMIVQAPQHYSYSQRIQKSKLPMPIFSAYENQESIFGYHF